MALHTDLLEQARHLALREPKKPRQASLRRAVSTAYYAVFHLLVGEATALLVPNRPGRLRLRVRRAFAHTEMKSVCEHFRRADIAALVGSTRDLVSAPIEPRLAAVAAAFVVLQEQRHSADYDLSEPWERVAALQNVARAEQALADWKAVRATPNARVFLLALLLQKQWNRA